MTSAVRPVTRNDLPELRRIIDETGLFPGEMLDAMAESYLAGTDGSFWLTFADAGGCQAVMFVEQERMTQGTYNQLLVAVRPARQGQGIGARLMREVERRIRDDLGGHLVLVETSALDDFARTRRFYEGLGYRRVAEIDDFYQKGEGKVIYVKAL